MPDVSRKVIGHNEMHIITVLRLIMATSKAINGNKLQIERIE